MVTMNKTVRNMCFVCSGIGEHDIWNRIPIFVHANPNEFRYWTKTMADMIEEIGGVIVSRCSLSGICYIFFCDRGEGST